MSNNDLKVSQKSGVTFIEKTLPEFGGEAIARNGSAEEYLAEQGAPVEFSGNGIKTLSTTFTPAVERPSGILASARGLAMQSIEINTAKPSEVRVLVDGCECTLETAIRMGRVVRSGSGYAEVPKEAPASATTAKTPPAAPGKVLGEDWSACRKANPSADSAFISLIGAACSGNQDRINHSVIQFRDGIGADKMQEAQVKKIANHLLGQLSNAVGHHLENSFRDLQGVGNKAVDKLLDSMSESEKSSFMQRVYWGDPTWKAEAVDRVARLARKAQGGKK